MKRATILLVSFLTLHCQVAMATIDITNVMHSNGLEEHINNRCTGSARIEASGTAGPFNILIMRDQFDGTKVMNVNGVHELVDLCSGNYSVEVVDRFGCVTSLSFEIIGCTHSGPLSIRIEQTAPLTTNSAMNGALEAIPSGSEDSDIEYSWTGPDGFTASTKSISGLKAGEYTVSAEDECGRYTAVYELISCEEVDIFVSPSVRNTCPGFAAGIIDLGFDQRYEFQWNDGATSARRENLTAGAYSVRITDFRGCTADRTYTVRDNVSVQHRWDRCKRTAYCHEVDGSTINYPEKIGVPRNGRCDYNGVFCEDPTERYVTDEPAQLTPTTYSNRTQCLREYHNNQRMDENGEPLLCRRVPGGFSNMNITNCNLGAGSFCRYEEYCSIEGDRFTVFTDDITVRDVAICHPGTGCIFAMYCGIRSPFTWVCDVFVPEGLSAFDSIIASGQYTIVESFDRMQSSYDTDFIYPNPLTHNITVHSSQNTIKLWVENNTGQVVQRNIGHFYPPETTYDVSRLPAGMYFMCLKKANGQVKRLKFIKVE